MATARTYRALRRKRDHKWAIPGDFPSCEIIFRAGLLYCLKNQKQLDYLEEPENLGVLRLGHPPLNENYKQAPLLLHGKRKFLSRRDTPAQPKEELFEKISKARELEFKLAHYNNESAGGRDDSLSRYLQRVADVGMQMVEPDASADMSTTESSTDHNLNLLEPFENMDSLRYFSNMVYVKYMSKCKRMEPPKDWVESLVNNESIKPEQSYYLESTGGYEDRDLQLNKMSQKQRNAARFRSKRPKEIPHGRPGAQTSRQGWRTTFTPYFPKGNKSLPS